MWFWKRANFRYVVDLNPIPGNEIKSRFLQSAPFLPAVIILEFNYGKSSDNSKQEIKGDAEHAGN